MVATMNAVEGQIDATSVALQTQVAVDLQARTNAYYATATVQANAMQAALAAAQNGATQTAVVGNAEATAAANELDQGAVRAQATLTANVAAYARPTNVVQQTEVAGLTATRAAGATSVALTATVLATTTENAP